MHAEEAEVPVEGRQRPQRVHRLVLGVHLPHDPEPPVEVRAAREDPAGLEGPAGHGEGVVVEVGVTRGNLHGRDPDRRRFRDRSGSAPSGAGIRHRRRRGRRARRPAARASPPARPGRPPPARGVGAGARAGGGAVATRGGAGSPGGRIADTATGFWPAARSTPGIRGDGGPCLVPGTRTAPSTGPGRAARRSTVAARRSQGDSPKRGPDARGWRRRSRWPAAR